MQELGVILLAAGQGTRMKSALPKVLHSLAGRPLFLHALSAAQQLAPARIAIVIGHGAEAVRQAYHGNAVAWAIQEKQLGTGHAVLCAKDLFNGFAGEVLILSGDVPLIKEETLRAMVEHHRRQQAAVTLLTASLDQPKGYGRVLRDGAGWRCVGGECEEVSGPMRDAMVLQAARAGAPWALLEHARDARAIQPLEFRGRSLPGVEVALGGGLTLDLYADPATHRIAVSRGFLEHGGVKTPFGTNFSDYRSVGGLWFAFGEENFASGAHTGNTTIEKIELNPKPAPNDFSAPVGREGES